MQLIFISCFYLSTVTACDMKSSMCNPRGADNLGTPTQMETIESVKETISEATENKSYKPESKRGIHKVRLLRRVISFCRRFLRRRDRLTEKQKILTKSQNEINKKYIQERQNPCIETNIRSIVNERPLQSVQQWLLNQRKSTITPKSINLNENKNPVMKNQNIREPTLELTENTKRILKRQKSEFLKEE